MKQELMKKITPIVDSFVDEILSGFKNLDKIRQELNQKEALYQDLVSQKEKELSERRIQKKVDKEEFDKKLTELECSKTEHLSKAKSYQQLYDELNKKRKDIENDLAKAKIELIQAKDMRIQAEKVKDDADKIKRDYETKLDSLKTDFNKNSEDHKLIVSEKSKLSVRENNIFVTETKQNELAKELNDQDLKIRVERKEIDRLIKRYNLEESLKEKS